MDGNISCIFLVHLHFLFICVSELLILRFIAVSTYFKFSSLISEMKILSSFTCPHVVPNLNDLLSSVKQ